ncbi:MAG TPA: hypothetical protein ENJ82_13780 [Bacteroidetes bacterium]|nr:hypothetical protein [Bacteroidota bacterium]
MRNYILNIILLLLSTGYFPGLYAQGTPPNDGCARALLLERGHTILGMSNMAATVGFEFETPATAETTCIQTIENDMWFKFQTEPGFEVYEVIISAGPCNTPSGLQALLIRSDDCNNKHYVYRGCSNKINTDTIKLFLHEPKAGLQYLVYVDGYDGTICEFDIQLRGKKRLSPVDYQYLRFDYELNGDTPYAVTDLEQSFRNNQTVIQWTASSEEDIALFVIELLPELEEVADASRYARVVGLVQGRNLVGMARSKYEFRDYITPFRDGQIYTYRLVKVSRNGQRFAGETFKVKAKMITSFFVGDPEPTSETGIYSVHYINNKKKADYDLYVLDEQFIELKHLIFEDEPVRDGNVRIDMREYPPGNYYFKMDNGKQDFLRLFIVD